ncbi:MAG TPA: condensation domain-containing protein, partial [Steroidobacteraceae bacterium]|nr:condensation domain-containing protein [Steroidobacteraceae bacterium]
VVLRAGQTLDATQLRAALAQQLPQPMLPAAFVPLADLPRGPGGKLDRGALPQISEPGSLRASYEAPQTPVEARIAQLWSNLLGVERIGRHDDFFALGGNSLLLIKFLDRLTQEDLQVDTTTLFAQPTIAQLAAQSSIRTASLQGAQEVAPNGIAPGCAHITPAMLPLVALEQQQIDVIESRTMGGARNIQDIYPLSPLQEGILVHHRTSGRDAYLTGALLAFESSQGAQQFIGALQWVVTRHDALRTAVQWSQLAEPVQVVWRSAPLAVEDVPCEGAAAAEALWRRGLSPMELSRAPLMRIFLAQEARPQRCLMLLQLHHLIGDHSSLELLITEVREYLAGRGEALPAPVPFRNSVALARSRQKSDGYEAYFREMLAGIDAATAAFGMLDVRGDGSGIEESRLLLETGLASRIRNEARRSGVAPSSLFHLAWAAVLGRISAREDVVFGTVLFGRMHGGLGTERVFGLHINTLPLRLVLGSRTVTEALRETHERLGQLLRHEHAPLAAVQRLSSLAPGIPLFSSVFNYRHDRSRLSLAADAELLPGARLVRMEGRTNYPLAVAVDDLSDGFNITAHAAGEVGAARICEYLVAALSAMTDALERAPRQALRTLRILPGEEWRTILRHGSGPAPAPGSASPLEYFDSQVRRDPQAVAAILGDRLVSYAELDARASRLARRLVQQGVGPERVVGLWADRSLEMLVGMLAVWKAGGAYLPLDPAYPAQRLELMVADAQPM